MYFLNKIYFALFIICAIIFIILFTVPIHPLILICKKKFRNNDIKMWKKLSLAIIFIVAFFGILINLVIFLNIYGLFSFYKECPYNFSYNDIANIFDISYKKSFKIIWLYFIRIVLIIFIISKDIISILQIIAADFAHPYSFYS